MDEEYRELISTLVEANLAQDTINKIQRSLNEIYAKKFVNILARLNELERTNGAKNNTR